MPGRNRLGGRSLITFRFNVRECAAQIKPMLSRHMHTRGGEAPRIHDVSGRAGSQRGEILTEIKAGQIVICSSSILFFPIHRRMRFSDECWFRLILCWKPEPLPASSPLDRVSGRQLERRPSGPSHKTKGRPANSLTFLGDGMGRWMGALNEYCNSGPQQHVVRTIVAVYREKLI